MKQSKSSGCSGMSTRNVQLRGRQSMGMSCRTWNRIHVKRTLKSGARCTRTSLRRAQQRQCMRWLSRIGETAFSPQRIRIYGALQSGCILTATVCFLAQRMCHSSGLALRYSEPSATHCHAETCAVKYRAHRMKFACWTLPKCVMHSSPKTFLFIKFHQQTMLLPQGHIPCNSLCFGIFNMYAPPPPITPCQVAGFRARGGHLFRPKRPQPLLSHTLCKISPPWGPQCRSDCVAMPSPLW